MERSQKSWGGLGEGIESLGEDGKTWRGHGEAGEVVEGSFGPGKAWRGQRRLR